MKTIKVVTPPCMVCMKRSTLTVEAESYAIWKSGALIQNAFPNMPKQEREQLLSGMHSECWIKVFPAKDVF